MSPTEASSTRHKHMLSIPPPRATGHPLHRRDSRPVSMPAPPSSPSSHLTTPKSNNAASRIMTSVRRSLSYSSSPKKRHPDVASTSEIYSATEYPYSPSRFRHYDPYATRPTIEQIAMGLHLSRTPHLRPVTKPYASFSHAQRLSAPDPPSHPLHPHDDSSQRSNPVLLSPPSRSSLKKSSVASASTGTPGLSHASASSTTMTSNAPSTPQSTRSLFSLKTRVSRFLPNSRSLPVSLSSSARSSMLSSPVSSPGASTTEFQPSAKKAVRFSVTLTGEEMDSGSTGMNHS